MKVLKKITTWLQKNNWSFKDSSDTNEKTEFDIEIIDNYSSTIKHYRMLKYSEFDRIMILHAFKIPDEIISLLEKMDKKNKDIFRYRLRMELLAFPTEYRLINEENQSIPEYIHIYQLIYLEDLTESSFFKTTDWVRKTCLFVLNFVQEYILVNFHFEGNSERPD